MSLTEVNDTLFFQVLLPHHNLRPCIRYFHGHHVGVINDTKLETHSFGGPL
jgi:hypothetical protein